MSVENPGDAEVDVDMETLKASLACPLCNDMYRFPVTVVRARRLPPRSLRSRALFLSSRLDRPPLHRTVFTHARIPLFPASKTHRDRPAQMECLHTFCHECIVKVVQPGKPSNACPKCAIALGNNPFVEKKIVRDGTKTSIVDKIREAGHFGGVIAPPEEADAAAAQ